MESIYVKATAGGAATDAATSYKFGAGAESGRLQASKGGHRAGDGRYIARDEVRPEPLDDNRNRRRHGRWPNCATDQVNDFPLAVRPCIL